MTGKTKPVTGAAIKQAIEGRNGRMLAAFYGRRRRSRRRPEQPAEQAARGSVRRAAIDMFWDDICRRAMTHKVDTIIADGARLAFTQACSHSGRAKVLWLAVLDLEDGMIVHQTVVQAWGGSCAVVRLALS